MRAVMSNRLSELTDIVIPWVKWKKGAGYVLRDNAPEDIKNAYDEFLKAGKEFDDMYPDR